jgi:ribosomal protein L12E/L44/L45/RPP1/RPP2
MGCCWYQSCTNLPAPFAAVPPAGGTVQQAAEAVDEKGEEMQRKAQQHQGQEKLKEETPGMSRDRP